MTKLSCFILIMGRKNNLMEDSQLFIRLVRLFKFHRLMLVTHHYLIGDIARGAKK